MPSSLSLRRALAAACGLGLTVGIWQATRMVPWDFEPPANHTAWVERYGSLRPYLAGAAIAQFVHDFGPDAAKHRLFRAQFVLAPCVLVDRRDVRQVDIGTLQRKPLILDFHTPRSLEHALATLSAAAETAGTTLEIQRLPGALATVRAGGGA